MPPLRVQGLLALVAIAFAAGAPAHAQDTWPRTIPALREWTPAAGSFRVHPDSRILVRDASLRPDAEVFAEDLAALLGFPIAVVTDANAPANDGDLSLGLGETDSRLEYTDFLPVMDVVGHAPGYELDARPEHTLPEPGVGSRALAAAVGLVLVWTLRRAARRVTPARPPSSAPRYRA